MVTYGYTILYVSDVAQIVAFYVAAFGFTQKMITPEGDYAELETGGTTLAFAAYSVAQYNGIDIAHTDPATLPPPCEIVFVTDNIEETFAQTVRAGATVVTEPVQKPWGQMVGYVRDVNGFLVEVCTKVE